MLCRSWEIQVVTFLQLLLDLRARHLERIHLQWKTNKCVLALRPAALPDRRAYRQKQKMLCKGRVAEQTQRDRVDLDEVKVFDPMFS